MHRKHFSTLLWSGYNTNTIFRDNVANPIGMEIPSSNHEMVKVELTYLKNNKAAGPDGLPAGGVRKSNELIGYMY